MNSFEQRKLYFEESTERQFKDRILNMVEELVISEISKNTFAMKSINLMYEQFITDESMYLQLAIESYDIMNIYLMNKSDYLSPIIVMSLFAFANKHNKPELISTMLKKAFKKEYKNVENNLMGASVEYIEKYKENIIHYYIASLLNIDKKTFNMSFRINAEHSINELFNSFSIIKVNKGNETTFIKEMTPTLKEFYINKNKNVSLENMLVNISYNKLIEFKKNIAIKNNITEDSMAMINILSQSMSNAINNEKNFLINELSSKSCKYFDFIFSIFNQTVRCSKEIEAYSLSPEELMTVLGSTYNAAFESFSKEEFPQLFLTAFVITVLGKIIVENTATVVQATTEKIEIESKATFEKNQLLKEIYITKEELNTKQSEINTLKEELEVLKRENGNLKSQISKAKFNKNKHEQSKKELEALKKLFFELGNKEELENKEIIQNNTPNNIIFNDSKNIAFIGSTSCLHSKLKNMFPNFTYITADEVCRDINFIKKYKKVFLHTHISHSMFNKVSSLIENLNIDLVFLNERNADILGNKILTEL